MSRGRALIWGYITTGCSQTKTLREAAWEKVWRARPRITCERVRGWICCRSIGNNTQRVCYPTHVDCFISTQTYHPSEDLKRYYLHLGETRFVQEPQRDDLNFVLGHHDWTESGRQQRETTASSDRRTVEGVVFWAITRSISGTCKGAYLIPLFGCSCLPSPLLPFLPCQRSCRYDDKPVREYSRGEKGQYA